MAAPGALHCGFSAASVSHTLRLFISSWRVRRDKRVICLDLELYVEQDGKLQPFWSLQAKAQCQMVCNYFSIVYDEFLAGVFLPWLMLPRQIGNGNLTVQGGRRSAFDKLSPF